MAELHVQPKKNKLWWLWILIVLVILALVYFYFRGNDNQLAISEAQIKYPDAATSGVYTSTRRQKNNIYSKAIVRYIKEAKPAPLRLYFL